MAIGGESANSLRGRSYQRSEERDRCPAI